MVILVVNRPICYSIMRVEATCYMKSYCVVWNQVVGGSILVAAEMGCWVGREGGEKYSHKRGRDENKCAILSFPYFIKLTAIVF